MRSRPLLISIKQNRQQCDKHAKQYAEYRGALKYPKEEALVTVSLDVASLGMSGIVEYGESCPLGIFARKRISSERIREILGTGADPYEDLLLFIVLFDPISRFPAKTDRSGYGMDPILGALYLVFLSVFSRKLDNGITEYLTVNCQRISYDSTDCGRGALFLLSQIFTEEEKADK